jgi:hypothetical protein
MANIYQEIQNDNTNQVEQLESDYARYIKVYNEIKGNKTWRFIGRTSLRGTAIICYILFFIVSILIIADFTSWGVGLGKVILNIPDNAPLYKIILRIALYLVIVLWPAIAFGICGYLIARIRRRNKIIHSLSELLEEIMSRTGANIQKARETQKHFELFASEIVKTQMEGK